MKIGNTSYNVEAIKAMSFDDFKKQFRGLIDTDLKETYKQLTGKEPREEKKESFTSEKSKNLEKK